MTYTVNGIEYDSNNIINQRILDKFCNIHIYLDMTMETNFIIHFLANYDSAYKELPFDLDDYDEALENAYDTGDPDAECPEVYEWYAVSERLAEHLKANHEIVIKTYDKFLWGRQSFGRGRQSFGQVVSLDYAIQKIAIDLGILQGQEFSWE